jgi:prophage regulatory protein
MTYTILRLPAVKAAIGLSRSSIYLRIADRTFPKPISLGARAVGWLQSDIDEWLRKRVESRGGPFEHRSSSVINEADLGRS